MARMDSRREQGAASPALAARSLWELKNDLRMRLWRRERMTGIDDVAFHANELAIDALVEEILAREDAAAGARSADHR